MRYYIADLHFFHAGMNTKMDCRGFESVEEMNEYMKQKWNDGRGQNDAPLMHEKRTEHVSSISKEEWG